jgi:hypothetical protein
MLLIIVLLFVFEAVPDTLMRAKATISTMMLMGSGGFTDSERNVFIGELPFWLHANQLGRVDPDNLNIMLRVDGNIRLMRRDRFGLDLGGDVIARASNHPSVHAAEAYVSGTLGHWRLDAGRRSIPAGLGSDPLSIGGLLMSTNATPPAGFFLSTPDYVPIPLAQGYLSFKAMFGNAWLMGPRYVSDPMIHRKHLYLRIDLFGFDGHAGLIHNAIWGGVHRELGRLPSSAGDFARVVFGRPGTDPRLGADMANVIGNNMAAYDFMLARNVGNWRFEAIRLFYLEDKVSMRFRSPWDGSWGARIYADRKRMPWMHTFVYDHVNTIRQDSKDGQPFGRADYYNHMVYRSGFTHYGRSLGLPLMSTEPRRSFRIDNNMILAHHVGLGGSPQPSFSYALRATYSRNYGTLNTGPPVRPTVGLRPDRRTDQWYTSIDMQWQPVGARWGLIGAVARDMGDLRKEDWGFMLGAQRKL